MSTQSPGPETQVDPDPRGRTERRPIPLHRLVRVELRKMVDTRSGLWLLLIIAVASLGAIGLFRWFGPEESHTFYGFVGMGVTPQAFLLPVLGILLVTSEWSQRAGLVTFTLEPRRGLVVLAKVLAAVIVGLLGLLLMNSTTAIVLYFVLPVAMNLLITFVEPLRDSAGWFDLGTGQAPLFTQAPLTGEQWAQLGTVTLLWIVLPLLLGWVRLRRTEIKTA